jgi:hypothetical protein
MSDDKEEKTLEHQEHFVEVAKSRDVEVRICSRFLFLSYYFTRGIFFHAL